MITKVTLQYFSFQNWKLALRPDPLKKRSRFFRDFVCKEHSHHNFLPLSRREQCKGKLQLKSPARFSRVPANIEFSGRRELKINCQKQAQLGERMVHIILCLLLWFEFFRTIALLLGALRDLIVRYSKSSSASVKCRREIFGQANFHPRVVSLGINVSSKAGDNCVAQVKRRPTITV